ncbi:5-methyltetrahydropteroyltriglutamate--homocysteine S-methyltransferase [Trichococcus shcherbakoviae]|uniref:5-methyltetrahydropteroyltriglutamate--homocysteine methyltransferase n=1 Tax=Trichococcus shcherbakoviae TaxID=2094020 RepID=A0A383TCE9_9LACT|nr:5-methyltetrahydropteroyltriglutamate--homocysteine S-methyltransferase [Trichococcus shcherbakoviae]SYZ77324.1 cobalamin-independent methionine synthase [Trichococcus shcherbakoviae]
MNSSVIGFPRVGKLRELKFASEKYFKQEISTEELEQVAKGLREMHWNLQQAAGISHIPSNDFSYYDNVLDLTVLLNALPENYRQLGLSERDTYFAAARGYQGVAGDVKALAMKKWFNTNYHYLVPELFDDTEIKLVGDKPFTEYAEAKEIGVLTKPVLIGGFTFLKLAKYKGSKTINDFADQVANAYIAILNRFNEQGVAWVQFDEPSLVTDLSEEDVALFTAIYEKVLAHKGNVKVLLQTYFGDIRDSYEVVIGLDFDGIGLDFIEGKKTVELLERHGFPADKTLFAGVLNGKNIWKSDYKKVIDLVNGLEKYSNDIVISTSCSLLHVPYTLENETSLPEEVSQYFAFAKERLQEIKELTELIGTAGYEEQEAYLTNQQVFAADRVYEDKHVQASVASLTERDFVRNVPRKKRRAIQKEKLQLGLLPTTTIGSFPQTKEVKQNRSKYRKGDISRAEYDENIKGFIKECIDLQEELGLDVLVHGESERNDMVEFFGENLAGYVFTEKAWVQSYGTRCVKPPIIFGDIRRENPITVFYSEYAQSLSDKPVKGMLTGPVTILNWSFPREDISLREMAFQIGLAIREEVLDLEEAGIKIIQIDEAALKEKLPIRREEWASEYLDWAIPAFRLCHSGVRPETQVHTHMCYSEFEEIVQDIDNMDADVISFEASRSKLTIIDALKANQFETEVGPGVYDIHSPRVPSVEEMVVVLKNALTKIDEENLWINPDCGLKTRGIKETKESLANLVAAAKIIKDAVSV